MKKLIVSIFALAFVVTAQAQKAQTYTLINGGTNNVATPATNTYSSVGFGVSDVDNLPIEFSFLVNGNDANAATNRLRLDIYGSATGNGNDNTAPKWSFTITPTVSNTVWCTNLDVTAKGVVSIDKIVIASTNALTTSYSTNLTLKVRPKKIVIDAQ